MGFLGCCVAILWFFVASALEFLTIFSITSSPWFGWNGTLPEDKLKNISEDELRKIIESFNTSTPDEYCASTEFFYKRFIPTLQTRGNDWMLDGLSGNLHPSFLNVQKFATVSVLLCTMALLGAAAFLVTRDDPWTLTSLPFFPISQLVHVWSIGWMSALALSLSWTVIPQGYGCAYCRFNDSCTENSMGESIDKSVIQQEACFASWFGLMFLYTLIISLFPNWKTCKNCRDIGVIFAFLVWATWFSLTPTFGVFAFKLIPNVFPDIMVAQGFAYALFAVGVFNWILTLLAAIWELCGDQIRKKHHDMKRKITSQTRFMMTSCRSSIGTICTAKQPGTVDEDPKNYSEGEVVIKGIYSVSESVQVGFRNENVIHLGPRI